uniref:Uncharacterized protein n=1 Tax=Pediastrum duplex TaxID=3105 RepID=A0A2U8GIQ9_PEDDU|nr:hypothetical protein [Pediastrum duplex]
MTQANLPLQPLCFLRIDSVCFGSLAHLCGRASVRCTSVALRLCRGAPKCDRKAEAHRTEAKGVKSLRSFAFGDEHNRSTNAKTRDRKSEEPTQRKPITCKEAEVHRRKNKGIDAKK